MKVAKKASGWSVAALGEEAHGVADETQLELDQRPQGTGGR